MAGRSVYERYGVSNLTTPVQVKRRHTVKGGDTIQAIAAHYFVDTGYDSELWRQVAEANDIRDLDDLEAGQVIDIPHPQASET